MTKQKKSRKLSAAAKEKIRLKAIGHKRNAGRKHKARTKRLISKANRGHKHTDELKRRLSEARIGIPLKPETLEKMRKEKATVLQCPYCDKVGKSGGMKKHHMNNCKLRRKRNAA